MNIVCNPGSFLAVEGQRLTLAGERVYMDGQPLDELLRDNYLQELEYHDDAVLQFGPARITIEARPSLLGGDGEPPQDRLRMHD